MYQLDCRCYRIKFVGVYLEALARGVNEQGAKALAAGQHRITHCLVQPMRCRVSRWQRVGQHSIDASGVSIERFGFCGRQEWALRELAGVVAYTD
jgi:hypothetical protein